MTLTYGELVDLCSLGKRLHYWRQSFPAKPDGILGVHVLTETWRFIPAPVIETDPQLLTIVQDILEKREVNQKGTANGQIRKRQSA
jgi:hypothetical protein